VFSIKRKIIIGKEETSRATSRGQKKKRDNLRERFIKNKRPLKPTHISPKKEKWPKS
jgi:hypothetical protein